MRNKAPQAAGRPILCSETEWQTRLDLAACYRLADHYGMGKVIWNHITARLPDDPQRFLVFRLGCRYDEVTASNLVKLDFNRAPEGDAAAAINYTAAVIHGGIYAARPEVMAVMHTHTQAGLGVSALKEGLLPLTQESMMFYGDLATHEFEGVSDDDSESARLARDLGGMSQMILRNHGLLTVGRSVGEAFWRMFQLNLACKVQLEVLATQREIAVATPEMAMKVRRQIETDFTPGKYEWPALRRQLDKLAPDYAS